ncbi:MAG: response regulator transcription factor [Actinomycetota bacterium]|jgi:CheY-like chemotaxis protein
MSPPKSEGRRPKVVLVDDDEETCVLLRSVLEDEGIEVVGVALDGVEAVELVDTLLPEVVLMDLRMPRMDGFEATRRIKDKHSWLQVVILTFYDDLLPERSPEEVGAFAYLVKGCSPTLMRDVIFKAWRVALETRWSRAAGSA